MNHRRRLFYSLHRMMGQNRAHQGTSSAQWRVVQDWTCHDGFQQKRTLVKPNRRQAGAFHGFHGFPMCFKGMGFLHCCPGAFFARTSGLDSLQPQCLGMVLEALSSPLPGLGHPQEQQPSSKSSSARGRTELNMGRCVWRLNFSPGADFTASIA